MNLFPIPQSSPPPLEAARRELDALLNREEEAISLLVETRRRISDVRAAVAAEELVQLGRAK